MKKINTRKFAVVAVLTAITLFLAVTPWGIISIPPANMSFLCLPILIGTMLCGLKTGMFLSAIFGISSLVKAFTAPSLLIAPLLGESPVLVVIMTIGARILIPVFAWLVYRAFEKKGKAIGLGTGLSALVGSLTNTVCYLGMMLLFYTMVGLDSTAVLSTVAGVGALNGSLEAAAAIIICTPVVLAVKKAKLV